MPFPLFKVIHAAFKLISRPVNQAIIQVIQHRASSLRLARLAFIQVGQWAHIFEHIINSKIVKDHNVKWVKDETEKDGVKQEKIVARKRIHIKPLNEEIAFQKGVEYSSEVIFFYSLLMGLALYEMKRNANES